MITREVSNRPINGVLCVPQCKALLHRYLICCGLSTYQPVIDITNGADDIIATKKCLSRLGIGRQQSIDERRSGFFTLDESNECDNDGFIRLPCGQSGTTYKFLLPLAGAFNKPCRFELDGNLVYDQMDGFYRVMRTHGLRREILRPDLIEVTGQLTAGTYILPGITDGQTLSGLLMALPCLKENSTVMVENPVQSEQYVDMTIALMRQAGIDIRAAEGLGGISRVYKVRGSQYYDMGTVGDFEGDWTLAAYWLAGAAISGGCLTCTNLDIESLQGDRQILNVLDQFGAKIQICWHDEPDINVEGQDIYWADVTAFSDGGLAAANIDATDIPDLVAPAILLACAANGISVIRNAVGPRMDFDRMQKMINVMTSLGAQITDTPDGIIVIGNGGVPLEGGVVDSHNDHKIAMMAAVAASICRNDVVIENCEVLQNAYPTFLNDLEKLK